MAEAVQENKTKPQFDRFVQDMTVGQALKLHPDVGLVLSGFHLGGCSHCGIAEYEKIHEVCNSYGVPVDRLLGALNQLLDEDDTDDEDLD